MYTVFSRLHLATKWTRAGRGINRQRQKATVKYTVFLQSSVCQGNHINPATSVSNKKMVLVLYIS